MSKHAACSRPLPLRVRPGPDRHGRNSAKMCFKNRWQCRISYVSAQSNKPNTLVIEQFEPFEGKSAINIEGL